jgi:hypothetical protein
MGELPRFVHKHALVYKMYTTLKLYYLHQQELLNQVLSILKEHIHSRELAGTLHSYIKQMHGHNAGWVSHIEKVLTDHMTPSMNMNGIYKAISHNQLVHRLHTIIHHAATHHHKMIGKMFHVLSKHHYTSHHYRHMMRTHHKMVRASNHIMHSVHHIFGHLSTRAHVVSHLKKIHRVTRTKKITHVFRTKVHTTKVVKKMLKHKSVRWVKHSLVKILKHHKLSKKVKSNIKHVLKKIRTLKRKVMKKQARKAAKKAAPKRKVNKKVVPKMKVKVQKKKANKKKTAKKVKKIMK